MSVIVVTGASGFVGRHLVPDLEGAGFPVRPLSRRTGGDLLDAAALPPLLAGARAVVHLAWLSGAEPGANRTAVRNLAEAAARAGVERFVHLGTAAVAGHVRGPWADETTRCRPVSAYAQAKLEIEKLLRAKRVRPPALTILRPTEVFGEGGVALAKLMRDLAQDDPATRELRHAMYGSRPMRLVPVETVVAVIRRALESPPLPDDLYLVSADEHPDNRHSAVEALARVALGLPAARLDAALPAPVLSLAQRLSGRFELPPSLRFDGSRLRATGFRPPVDFREALERQIGRLARAAAS